MHLSHKLGTASVLLATALAAAACGGGTTPATSGSSTTAAPTTAAPSTTTAASSTTTGATSTTTSASSTTAGGGGSGGLSASSLSTNYSVLNALKPLVKAGKGSIEVILPDTTTSARYTEFDAPDLNKAFLAAGLTSSQFKVQNAHGSDSTQLTDAQAAISSGASVLVVDPLDSGVGAQIESYAKSHGVKVIDYDRLTLGGSRAYYVSFNNVNVGKLMGQGLVTCEKAWGVS
ncbi:MAG: substrate-binding domain-containing protein, partial [Acidimicrobiales bacterium]